MFNPVSGSAARINYQQAELQSDEAEIWGMHSSFGLEHKLF